MNELAAKALFFSQYLHKQVIYKNCTPMKLGGVRATNSVFKGAGGTFHTIYKNTAILTGDWYGIGVERTGICSISECSMFLRSIDQLTDEEAYEVAKKAYTPLYDHPMTAQLIRLGKDVLNLPHFSEKTATYLKLIGVLVRFSYIDEQNEFVVLEPDDIIKLGWAKIM